MCGIVGYIGTESAAPIILAGLHRLEYRGYDSAGIALLTSSGLKTIKSKGRVDELEAKLGNKYHTATTGIGHTRWATHGIPNELNAHPHTSYDGIVSLVHNGIIENYAQIKTELSKKGVTFYSETDTEVLANLIAVIKSEENVSLFVAMQHALKLVRGAYAIAALTPEEPDSLVVAKQSSPMAIGIAENGFIIGSDATPIITHTKHILYIQDGEVAELRRDKTYSIMSLAGEPISHEVEELEFNIDKLEKGGYPHFMLKEINEQPAVIHDTMRGRLSLDEHTILLGGISDYEQRILRAPKISIVACGTSWHAGLVGKFIIEELTGIPVDVDYASEFRYRKIPLGEHDVVLAISQSGETADTLACIELANARHALTLGLVNNVGSSIARATKAGVYTHAGPEISVASTKAFTTQVTALTLLALRLAQQLGTLPQSRLQTLYQQFACVPNWVSEALQCAPAAKAVVDAIKNQRIVMFLGRNNCYPVALEGALKLKEIAYIAAEGYPAGEMKHGPIALIQPGTPVIVIVPSEQELREKLMSNIAEVKARGAYIIAIGDDSEGISYQLSPPSRYSSLPTTPL
jgi:glucosamine--fructose-6-phosphate aminotransferase (isomerizing)